MSGTPEARLSLLGGDGPDLLLVHGFGSDRLSWAATAHAFFATRKVWAVDLPGHGDAPAEVADGSPEALARAVAAVVAPPLARPFAVVAHSLGGAVAMRLARLLPEAISSLVLISPAGLGLGVDRSFLDAFPRLQTETDAMALLQRLVVRPRLIAPAMAQHVVGGLQRPGRREALMAVGAALSTLPAAALPGGVPVRMIWGAADSINPLEPGQAASWGEQLVLLPDTGHMPQMEAASRVNRFIAGALDQ